MIINFILFLSIKFTAIYINFLDLISLYIHTYGLIQFYLNLISLHIHTYDLI